MMWILYIHLSSEQKRQGGRQRQTEDLVSRFPSKFFICPIFAFLFVLSRNQLQTTKETINVSKFQDYVKFPLFSLSFISFISFFFQQKMRAGEQGAGEKLRWMKKKPQLYLINSLFFQFRVPTNQAIKFVNLSKRRVLKAEEWLYFLLLAIVS